MDIYTTEVIIDIRLIKTPLDKIAAKFYRLMRLPFDPYTAKDQPLKLSISGEPLSVMVVAAEWSETRTKLPRITLTRDLFSVYTMWTVLEVDSEAIFESVIKQLQTDSEYERI